MEIDVRHIAKLARLEMEEADVEGFAQEMGAIVAMVENLPELSGAGALLDPEDTMKLREDEIQPSYDRDKILKNAPQTANGCFLVPKTVE